MAWVVLLETTPVLGFKINKPEHKYEGDFRRIAPEVLDRLITERRSWEKREPSIWSTCLCFDIFVEETVQASLVCGFYPFRLEKASASACRCASESLSPTASLSLPRTPGMNP